MFTYLKIKNIFFVAAFFLCLFSASHAKAANVGDSINFNINKDFDVSARSQVSAVLVKNSHNLYFYVEKNWWDLQVLQKQNEILSSLDNLSYEFSNKIYPNLTSVFGSEWKPGIDNDNKITILFHAMEENAGGYFRSADEYIKLQITDSNEREMLYLSVSHINDARLKIFLAHEFVHLITFNQKDKPWNIQEDIWLNEARADYALTILGYNDVYKGSNLQARVNDFLNSPSDALTEWQETKYDYAVVNLFMHYLVDHYGINILTDSLKSKLVGIPSINEALLKNSAKKSFADIFTDWTITMVINNCSYNLKYCYLSKNLNDLRINPTLIFLPLTGNSSLSVTNITKNWSGNWQKVIGGNGDLKLEFSSLTELNFQVPYILYGKDNSYSLDFLKFDKNKNGEINIEDFGQKYNSLIMIPSLQTKSSGFDIFDLTYPYTFKISVTGNVLQEDVILIQKLLAQIDSLKKQIVAIQAGNPPAEAGSYLCKQINNNLYFGISNNDAVRCLQQFLKNQGQDIYPEGLVTGNFGVLTKSAVIRFQKEYQIFQTGFVGIITRTKINQILNAT